MMMILVESGLCHLRSYFKGTNFRSLVEYLSKRDISRIFKPFPKIDPLEIALSPGALRQKVHENKMPKFDPFTKINTCET